jgi:hypothetical protein
MSGPGGGGAQVSMDGILFQMLADSVEEMRRLRDSPTICRNGKVIPGALREGVPPWKRGQIVNSAAYLQEFDQDGKWAIPKGAVEISQQILDDEAIYLDELQAASLAGVPWQGTFDAWLETCIRCGEVASWRFVMKPASSIPVETSWRLGRPENAVPLCRRCAHTTQFEQREDIRFDLAWGLWASRFEALHRWHLAVQYDWLPEKWSKDDYPLWPREYGGSSWKEGSGSYVYCLPRPPRGIKRLPVHFSALNRAMGVATKRREKIGPYFSALQLKHVIPDPHLKSGDYYCERGCIYRGTGACSYCSRDRNSLAEQAVIKAQ